VVNFWKKILKSQVSCKPVQREPRYFMRTEERTDITKLIVAFRTSANAPKDCTFSLRILKDDEMGRRKRNAYKVLVRKPEEKLLEDLDSDGG
jgi:hypothetical protein